MKDKATGKERLYMAVTKDRLSLPLAVADSAAELARLRGEKDGLIAGAREMLNQGDALNFDWFCWLAHLRYMTMVGEKRGVIT